MISVAFHTSWWISNIFTSEYKCLKVIFLWYKFQSQSIENRCHQYTLRSKIPSPVQLTSLHVFLVLSPPLWSARASSHAESLFSTLNIAQAPHDYCVGTDENKWAGADFPRLNAKLYVGCMSLHWFSWLAVCLTAWFSYQFYFACRSCSSSPTVISAHLWTTTAFSLSFSFFLSLFRLFVCLFLCKNLPPVVLIRQTNRGKHRHLWPDVKTCISSLTLKRCSKNKNFGPKHSKLNYPQNVEEKQFSRYDVHSMCSGA